MEKNRILVLIDGFNYYHKLKEYQDKYKKCVKWLNYKSLVDSWLKEAEDDLNNVKIFYFTAIAYWRGEESVARHKTYINTLKTQNIIPVYGEFKVKKIHRWKTNEKCENCDCDCDKSKLIRHEEKNSDVNLAITLIEKTIKNEYDKCFILSGDNDFASAIKRAKEIDKTKKIIIQPPPLAVKRLVKKRDYAIENLENSAQSTALLTNFYTILKHQFEDEVDGFENPWKN